jgi:stress response protein YsnF
MTTEDDEKSELEDIVVPVVAEEPIVGKRTIETGHGVRVTKTVSEREAIVDVSSLRDEVHVERTRIDREVAPSALPNVRQEGDTLVVPVLEEVPVVAKRIILVEEIRIRRSTREVSSPQRLVLKVEHVSVEPLKDAGEQPAGETTTEGRPS